MENASKAILIAGGVLLGVLLLAFLIFFWTNMSTFVAGGSGEAKEQQIAEFNQEFETYNRGQRSDRDQAIPIYGSDIITIINKIETYNEDPEGVFNGKVQYEEIAVNVILDNGTNSIADLDLFKESNAALTTVSGKKQIKDAANNKLFNKDSGIIHTYIEAENKYGKDFMNKISANYERILKLMHVKENSGNYGISSDQKDWDQNDPGPDTNGDKNPDGYDYLGAIKKVTGRNLSGTYDPINDPLKASTSAATLNYVKDQLNFIKNYSDYTAFKTSQFICEGTEYNSKTGQINKMTFKFSRR